MAGVDHYARTKNALIGCVGVTAIAFAGLYVTVQRKTSRRPIPTRPCLEAGERIRPLLSGDSVRLVIRSLENGSDCAGKPPTGFVWETADAKNIELLPDGLVRGRTPGRFTAVARHGNDSVRADGFVLPQEWRARIEPDSVTLRVGDTLRMVMRAVDQNNVQQPDVPYSIFTPEFFDPVARKRPIINQLSWQEVIDPVLIVATDTGTTVLIGRIGFQQVAARLVIRPRT